MCEDLGKRAKIKPDPHRMISLAQTDFGLGGTLAKTKHTQQQTNNHINRHYRFTNLTHAHILRLLVEPSESPHTTFKLHTNTMRYRQRLELSWVGDFVRGNPTASFHQDIVRDPPSDRRLFSHCIACETLTHVGSLRAAGSMPG